MQFSTPGLLWKRNLRILPILLLAFLFQLIKDVVLYIQVFTMEYDGFQDQIINKKPILKKFYEVTFSYPNDSTRKKKSHKSNY